MKKNRFLGALLSLGLFCGIQQAGAQTTGLIATCCGGSVGNDATGLGSGAGSSGASFPAGLYGGGGGGAFVGAGGGGNGGMGLVVMQFFNNGGTALGIINLVSGTSYTIPNIIGITSMKVWAIGAGGGGAGGGREGSIQDRGTGGGAGGVAFASSVSILAGQIVSYTIGTAGLGSGAPAYPNPSYGNGLDGGVTTFSYLTTSLTGNGGGGGQNQRGYSGALPGGTGGTASGGDINATGGTGGQSNTSNTTSTAGGGINGANAFNNSTSNTQSAGPTGLTVDNLFTAEHTFILGATITVNVTALLQGALPPTTKTTPMSVALNTNGLIPTTQPYSDTTFNHATVAGTEDTVTAAGISGKSTVVDWILVELRDANVDTVLAGRAAFITSSGQVVDLDGTTTVNMGMPTNGTQYYVAVRHRNHLGVRSASAIAPSSTNGITYDFTTAQAQAYQDPNITTNAAMAAVGSVFAMWAGNAHVSNIQNKIQYTGLNSDEGQLRTILGLSTLGTSQAIYSTGDFNLDGKVSYTGLNSDEGLLRTVIGLSTLGTAILEHL